MYFKSSTQKALILNRYYRITKFYSFLKAITLKSLLITAIFVGVVVFVEFFLFDIESALEAIISKFSDTIVYSFFFLSETFFGLVPPEIFIAYAAKTSEPWAALFGLAFLSYMGGAISYLGGVQLAKVNFIKTYIEDKIGSHIQNLRKWGGLFVVIGAVSPVPHSIVSLASGLINFGFMKYLAWSLFRFLRFVIYAMVIFKIL